MSATKRLIAAVAAVIGLVMLAASLGSAASAYPAGKAPKISLNKSSVPAGSPVTVFGSQFTPNQKADLSLHSTPVALGVVTIDANGDFTAQVTIPSSVPNGQHTVEALDVASGDIATAPLMVTGSTSGGGGGTGGGGGGLSGTGVAVLGMGTLGVVLLVGGGLMLMAGRRRKVTV